MTNRQPQPTDDRSGFDAGADGSNAPPRNAAPGSTDDSDDSNVSATDYRGTGIMWTGALVVVAVALALIAGLQNTQDVEIHFLWLDGSMPLVLLLLIAIAATVVVTEAIGFVWRHRRRRRLREREELKRLRPN